jgi:hypothetical protein
MFKRIIALILMALIVISCPACAQKDHGDTATTDATVASTSTAEQTTVEETKSEEEKLFDTLPQGDFKGKTFCVLNVALNWADTPFSAEEIMGEALNDALYARDAQLKDTLGIQIEEIRDGGGNIDTAVAKSVLAQDGAYQAVINQMRRVGSYVQYQYTEDMSTYSELQFDKPWWNREMIDFYNFTDKIMVLFGDFHIGWATSHYIIGFSKSLVEDNNLENPYDLLETNEWTWDKMYEMMNVVAHDVNGDGQYTTEFDVYGIGHHNNAPKCFVMSANVSLLEYDNEGIPSFTAHKNEKYLSAWEKMITYFASDARLVSMPGIEGFQDIKNSYKTLFSEGRLLFYDEVIGTLRDQRESPHEYGIMPHPKYEASQEAYYSPVNPDAMTMIIPYGDTDREMTGVVLENLCARSYESVMPVFVETTLHYKYAQDAKAIAVLNTVLESNMFDIAFSYNWGDIISTLDVLAKNGQANITSKLKGEAGAIEKMIAKTMDSLTKS